jgi:hypothetical protein
MHLEMMRRCSSMDGTCGEELVQSLKIMDA